MSVTLYFPSDIVFAWNLFEDYSGSPRNQHFENYIIYFSDWTQHPSTTHEPPQQADNNSQQAHIPTYMQTRRHTQSQAHTHSRRSHFFLLLFRRRSSSVVAFDVFGCWLSLSSSVSFGVVCCCCCRRFLWKTDGREQRGGRRDG